MRWVGHVASMRENRNVYKMLLRRTLQEPRCKWKIILILKLFLKKQGVKVWT